MKIDYAIPEVRDMIKKVRMANGRSVRDMASATGFSKASIYNYENGSKSIDLRYLAKLNELLGLNMRISIELDMKTP